MSYFKSKSNSSISLEDHSRKVSELAVIIAEDFLMSFTEKDTIIKAVKYGALLHDIGKAVNGFQNYIKTGESTSPEFYHNEIAWAFLNNYINIDDPLCSELILDCVYWHHGIDKEMGDDFNDDILNSINNNDINNIKLLLSNLKMCDIFDYNKIPTKNITPNYYDLDEKKNRLRIIVRSVVVSADRIVSEYITDENIDNISLKKLLDSVVESNRVLLDHIPYKNQRFYDQQNIVEQCKKTTMVNAPAGFGKTILGMLWSIKSNNKTLWVCPYNMVAESVYDSIIKELEAFKLDLNVELYLTGEVIKRNWDGSREFDSDIIITNIDNFLSPTYNNSYSDRLFFINKCDVVFDEYHKLVCDQLLFSLFMNIMYIRNNYTNSQTLLLSATPTNIHHRWDSFTNKTTILPKENKHYRAVHNKKYKIYIQDDLDDSSVILNNSLIINNSVRNAQVFKKKYNNKLLHSYYRKSDKNDIFDYLLLNYGKNKKGLTKDNIIGTHIIQESLDISFKHLYESVLSPESTLQRIGRCNRWGEYSDGVSEITIFTNKNSSNRKSIDMLYDIKLNILWFNYLKKQNINRPITLDDLYVIYNKFFVDNINAIDSFINNKYNVSLKKIKNIFPKKYTIKRTDILNASGNVLRSDGTEIFYICRRIVNGKISSTKWSEVFNTSIYNDFDIDFKENSKTESRIIKEMTKLNNQNGFDYSFVTKRKAPKMSTIKKMAKKSNSPYIRFDILYHDDYGLIKEDLAISLGLISI